MWTGRYLAFPSIPEFTAKIAARDGSLLGLSRRGQAQHASDRGWCAPGVLAQGPTEMGLVGEAQLGGKGRQSAFAALELFESPTDPDSIPIPRHRNPQLSREGTAQPVRGCSEQGCQREQSMCRWMAIVQRGAGRRNQSAVRGRGHIVHRCRPIARPAHGEDRQLQHIFGEPVVGIVTAGSQQPPVRQFQFGVYVDRRAPHAAGFADQLPPALRAELHRRAPIAAVGVGEMLGFTWCGDIADGRVEIQWAVESATPKASGADEDQAGIDWALRLRPIGPITSAGPLRHAEVRTDGEGHRGQHDTNANRQV